MIRPYSDPPGDDAPEFPCCEINEDDLVCFHWGRFRDSEDLNSNFLDYDESMLLMHRLCALHGYKAVKLPDMTDEECKELRR